MTTLGKRFPQIFMFILVMFTGTHVFAQAAAKAPDPGLVGMLTKQLGVTPQQATGGAGAIFSLAKNNLSSADFSKIASAVPGMGSFLNAAPKPQNDATSSAASSAASALGPLAGGASGGAAANATGLLGLGSSFKSLGLSPEMATKFAPVIQQYLASKGGGVASIFSKAIGM
jgi:hypothetical protein